VEVDDADRKMQTVGAGEKASTFDAGGWCRWWL